MDVFIYILQQFLLSAIDLFSFALLIRVVLALFDPMQEWKLTEFLHVITEPVVLPLRVLCAKMHWFEGTPLDVPLLLTGFVLILLEFFISML